MEDAIMINEVRQIINEELSVSSEVVKLAKELKLEILRQKKMGRKEKENIIAGDFKYTFWGVSFLVYYNIIYLNRTDELKSLVLPNGGGWCDVDEKEMFVVLVYVREKNEFYEYTGSLQHELTHIYQHTMAWKRKGQMFKIDNPVYEKAIKLISSNDNIEGMIGYALYYCRKSERDALVNGFYKELVENKIPNPLDYLSRTNLYYNLKSFKENIIDTDIYYDFYETVLKKEFNKSLEWFLKIVKNGYQSYLNKIGKVIAKYEKDYLPKTRMTHFTGKVGKIKTEE